MAAKNKYLAEMNKSGTAGKATKKREFRNRVVPMGANHLIVPAIKQALRQHRFLILIGGCDVCTS
jgi:hypothetical protein